MKELLQDVDAVIGGLGPLVHHFAGKTVILSGARGYLGRYIVATLVRMNEQLAAPCTVVALDSNATGAKDDRADWRNVPNLYSVQHDVRHEMSNAWFSGEGPDMDSVSHVLHLAGIASPYWYKKLPRETIDVSVEGSRNMLYLAKLYGAKYLFTSSSEVYQTATVVPTPETYVGAVPTLNERSCYDVGKLMGETLAYVAAQQDGTHASVVRIFNSFGPGMAERDKRILPRIASAVKAKRALCVFGHKGRMPKRTYTPVANTVLGLFLVMLKGDGVGGREARGVYNVGLDTPEVTVPELIERVRALGYDLRYDVKQPDSNYETEPMRRCPDTSRLKGLGFMPVVDLDAGLDRFMRWAMTAYTGEA